MMPRLMERYRQQIVPELMRGFHYTNRLQTPRLVKIVANMGVGEAAHDAKALEEAVATLAAITGQKPLVTRAHKAISNFKIKIGDPVGCKVTLRGVRMYEFLDRLVNVAAPRIRDFRGLPLSGFDGSGNYTIGLKDQLIFPEIEFDSVKVTLGMDITFVTSARRREEAQALLRQLGMPFAEK